MFLVVFVLFCLFVNCVCIGSPAYWGRVSNVGLNFGLGLGWEPATTGSATDPTSVCFTKDIKTPSTNYMTWLSRTVTIIGKIYIFF